MTTVWIALDLAMPIAAMAQFKGLQGAQLYAHCIHCKVNKQLRARPLIGQPVSAVSLEVVNSEPLDWQKVRPVIGILRLGVNFNSATQPIGAAEVPDDGHFLHHLQPQPLTRQTAFHRLTAAHLCTVHIALQQSSRQLLVQLQTCSHRQHLLQLCRRSTSMPRLQGGHADSAALPAPRTQNLARPKFTPQAELTGVRHHKPRPLQGMHHLHPKVVLGDDSASSIPGVTAQQATDMASTAALGEHAASVNLMLSAFPTVSKAIEMLEHELAPFLVLPQGSQGVQPTLLLLQGLNT